jgi:ABC-type transport system involved in cytochrome c biogenesis permease subunit
VLLIGLATAAHLAGLVAYTIRFRELPLVGLAPSLSTLTFLIAVFFFLAALASDARPVGLVLLPVIALLLGVAFALGIEPAGEALAFRGVWFAFHVVLALIGIAGFAFVFAAGLLYLLQFRELKSKRFGRVFRFFPPLNTLDTLGRSAAIVGFCALSVALALGWAWTIRFENSLALRDPQVLWGAITWVAFAGVLGARLGGPTSNRRAALVSVIGFGIVVLSFVVLRVVMTGFHSLV